jgi:tetratricopeptide (TPR) repeat protein
LSTLGFILVTAGCWQSNPAGNPGFQPASSSGDSPIELGTKLFRERKFAEALVHLEAAIDQPHSTPPSMLLTAIGNCYNELEDYEKAIEFHDRAIAADPRNHKAFVNRGIAYRLQGDYDQAEASYTQALELEPNYAELHASLGSLAIHRGNFAAGVEHLERALQLDPNLAVAHANLALSYASLGRFADADRELKTAIVQGYRNGPLIQERIDALKKTDEPK